jgi:hypothetical protein
VGVAAAVALSARAAGAPASANGGIEGEPRFGVHKVEFSAPRREISTLCSHTMHNVDLRGRSADFSTFCTPIVLPLNAAVRPRPRYRLTAAPPPPTMTVMPGTSSIATHTAIVAACSIIAIAT